LALPTGYWDFLFYITLFSMEELGEAWSGFKATGCCASKNRM
jgi:hypothetical protein